MLIGVAICTLDGVHLAGPNSARLQDAYHLPFPQIKLCMYLHECMLLRTVYYGFVTKMLSGYV